MSRQEKGLSAEGPLDGHVVVDLLGAGLGKIGRIFAGLGARVLLPEWHGRYMPPVAGVAALTAEVANAGKQRVRLDETAAARTTQWIELLADADLLLLPSPLPVDVGMSAEELDAALPTRAVRMTVSPFGLGNAHSDWQATDPVLHALSSELSRSGVAGRAPLLPPGELALECAMSQGAFVAMSALFAAQRTGQGDRIDFSLLDGAVQALDPGFGIAGSATLGRSAAALPPGRPAAGTLYPIHSCADGKVRICVLAPRQWQNMFRWMGSPPAFAGPEFNRLDVRQASAPLQEAMADFFAVRTKADLVAEGAARGVPISAVLTLEECLATDHVQARGVLVEAALADGRRLRLPKSPIAFGATTGGTDASIAARRPAATAARPTPELPLTGLKVLDLGVIVVGGEQGRLLADLGADVVKVESAAFPDGTRHSYLPTGLSVGFAAGHRNKRSLGLDLRHPDGKALFLRLAAEADVILSNFKPGTMEALGFDHATIATVNPGIVMIDSSAFGSDGPWAARMGYGPLVRAASGLTSKWCYPDDPSAHSDAVTIYPDHSAARYGAIATLALLHRRTKTGRGGTASISQLDVMLDHFSAEIAARAAGAEGWEEPVDAPWGVFQAQGDDQWCVVTVRQDADWRALAAVMGRTDWLEDEDLSQRAGRLRRRAEIEAGLAAWMLAQDAEAAMRLLQEAGVPAAQMLRIADLPGFSYYRQRGLFRVDRHPYLEEDVIAERFHAHSRNVRALPAMPAPLMGQHSAEVVQHWLGLSVAETEVLFASGVLQGVDPAIEQMLAAGLGRGERSPA
ncbi:MAG: CoA transferase [Pseudomonadota bacterium]